MMGLDTKRYHGKMSVWNKGEGAGTGRPWYSPMKGEKGERIGQKEVQTLAQVKGSFDHAGVQYLSKYYSLEEPHISQEQAG